MSDCVFKGHSFRKVENNCFLGAVGAVGAGGDKGDGGNGGDGRNGGDGGEKGVGGGFSSLQEDSVI